MDWKEITIYKFANKNNYIQILIINWKIFMPDGRHTSISSCFSKKCLFQMVAMETNDVFLGVIFLNLLDIISIK